MNPVVSVVPCEDYALASVTAALEQALAPLGGLTWVQPGMRIVLKANLVSAMAPEKAATVHPSVLCALTKLLRSRGANVIIGDSPGGLYNAAYLNHVYHQCGLPAAEDFGAKLNDDFSLSEASYPAARKAHQFPYTAYLDGADAIIDVCKLKTHGMMGLSCGVKNMFGVIPGTQKPEFHYKYPNISDFSEMLLDLYSYFAPRLVICDAVYGMEGNGPTQGTPRKIGCLLASEHAHALDLVAAHLIGLSPEEVPTLAAAIRHKLCPDNIGEISLIGDIAPLIQKTYHTIPSQATVEFRFGGKLGSRTISQILTPRPVVRKDSCIGCGKCASICPASAISMEQKRPRIDRSRCIHCFCCQEFCPVGAMQVGRTALARLVGK